MVKAISSKCVLFTGSGVVLDCIDSRSLPSFLFYLHYGSLRRA